MMPPTGWLLIAGVVVMAVVVGRDYVRYEQQAMASQLEQGPIDDPVYLAALHPPKPTPYPRSKPATVWPTVADLAAAEAPTLPIPTLFSGPCAGLFGDPGPDVTLGVTEVPSLSPVGPVFTIADLWPHLLTQDDPAPVQEDDPFATALIELQHLANATLLAVPAFPMEAMA